jgi:ParB family transcriptional regulator, chromosome partitioning protein
MSKNKEALGKGIRALLKNIDDEAAKNKNDDHQLEQAGSVVKIPLTQIEVNPFQPRVEFNDDALRELSESIKIHGVVQPVTVRKIGNNKFQLIAGERRLRASKLAGITDIPAYVRSANDQESLEIALIENIQREDLNSLEIGLNYQRLIDECALTHDEVSKRLGVSRAAVTNYLRLLKLPPDIQKGLKSRQISMGHARCLAGVEDIAQQLYLFKEVVSKNLSVRQTEELLRTINEKPGKSLAAKQEKKLPYAYQKVQDKIASGISSRVKLKVGAKGSGEIVIYFHSDDDLERITDLLSNN